MKFAHLTSQNGQALVTLLFFVLIAVIVSSAAVVLILLNSLSATKLQEGSRTYTQAESGIENALLRLLRDPNYSGEVLPIDDGTITIEVSGGGSSPYIIRSTSVLGDFTRSVQATAAYSDNILTVSSWEETF